MIAQAQAPSFVCIVDIAEQAGLKLVRMRKPGQFKTNCPFCADKKMKLELNVDMNVFHCWVCDSGGGLISFYALLYNVSEATARETLFPLPSGRRRFTHPALTLTKEQLAEIGFTRACPHKRPSHWSMREWGRYRKRTLDWVWGEWKRYNAWKNHFDRRISKLLLQNEKKSSSDGEETNVETRRTGTH